jgi:hypothetical protein
MNKWIWFIIIRFLIQHPLRQTMSSEQLEYNFTNTPATKRNLLTPKETKFKDFYFNIKIKRLKKKHFSSKNEKTHLDKANPIHSENRSLNVIRRKLDSTSSEGSENKERKTGKKRFKRTYQSDSEDAINETKRTRLDTSHLLRDQENGSYLFAKKRKLHFTDSDEDFKNIKKEKELPLNKRIKIEESSSDNESEMEERKNLKRKRVEKELSSKKRSEIEESSSDNES